MSSRFLHHVLPLLFLAGAAAQAAPGKLTNIGPWGAFDGEAETLVFPSSDPRRMLLLTEDDLHETRDGGVNWRSVLSHHPQISPIGLVTSPGDPERWYLYESYPFVHGGVRIWQTADGGGTWSTLALPRPDAFSAFLVDARDPATLAVETTVRIEGDLVSEIWVSRDHGAHWRRLLAMDGLRRELIGLHDGVAWLHNLRIDIETGVSRPHPFGHPLFRRGWLVFDRVDPRILFHVSSSTQSTGVSKSIDGGESWFYLVGNTPELFAQSPFNPSHLLMIDFGRLYLSLDRGASWVDQGHVAPFGWMYTAAFDPASGEVVFASVGGNGRRRLDGSYVASPSNGLPPPGVDGVGFDGERLWALSAYGRLWVRDGEGFWQGRGFLDFDGQPPSFDACSGWTSLLLWPHDPLGATAVCGPYLFVTRDGGWTWQDAEGLSYGATGYPTSIGRRDGPAGPSHFVKTADRLYRSGDFGASWQPVGEAQVSTSLVVHPDSARGMLSFAGDDQVLHFHENTGWRHIATVPLAGVEGMAGGYYGLAYDPAHPELIYLLVGESGYYQIVRSQDFGSTWEVVHPPSVGDPYLYDFALQVDPRDPDRLYLTGTGLASADGGRTFDVEEPVLESTASGPIVFDREDLDHFYVASWKGLLEHQPSLPPCPAGSAAWCAQNGRFQVIVDWRDPQGQTGKARRVATGVEDSGLFYFFDENNWELLVKVLDGCGLNQRFWVFSAGTTNVEYSMRVEDRWTGQVREYANAGGEAAPATIDTDAFSGCGAVPPPGAATAPPSASPVAAGGEAMLALIDGQFEVRAEWTDFAGVRGPGLTAPLRSANSGLFYFFSPNNWETLVKVLDGCAINGHYWVLGAATTNVGYTLEVLEPATQRRKTYTNPVGRASPAMIDTAAFACR